MRTLTNKIKGIILCDVDDTIVGPDFQLTVSVNKLKAAVENAQDNGYLVGLASDRPAKMLAKNAFEWGMQGPIIVENGAAIMLDAADEVQGVQEWTRSFPQLQRIFTETVQLLDSEGLGYRVVSGDSRHIISNLKSADWISESVNTLAIMNGEREYSMSFFVRKRFVGGEFKGEWELHGGELRYLAGIAEKVLALSSHSHRFRTTLIEDIGICIISDRDTTKQRGLYLLREHFGRGLSVFMIGNSIHDFLGNGVEHYAVSNATDAYRDRGVYFAGNAYTQGVVDLLGHIVDPNAAYLKT